MQDHVEPGTEARAVTWTKAIAVLIIGAVATFGWQSVSNASHAVQPIGQTIRADSHMTEMCLMPKPAADTDAPICPGAAKKKARQFRKHKLGNAKGVTIPKFMQKRIKKKWRKMHGRSADGCCDWITDPLKSTACLVTNPTGTHRGVCDEGQRSVNELMEKTTKVIVKCGGAAIVGAGKNGGSTWGAGAGSGLCLWGLYFDWIF